MSSERGGVMKRDVFTISYQGRSVIKSKWNSARREVENIIRDIARTEGAIYERISDNSIKEGAYHIKGAIAWRSGTGKVINFTIEKTL